MGFKRFQDYKEWIRYELSFSLSLSNIDSDGVYRFVPLPCKHLHRRTDGEPLYSHVRKSTLVLDGARVTSVLVEQT